MGDVETLERNDAKACFKAERCLARAVDRAGHANGAALELAAGHAEAVAARFADGIGFAGPLRAARQDGDARRAQRQRMAASDPVGYAQHASFRLGHHDGDAFLTLGHRDEGCRLGVSGQLVQQGPRTRAELRLEARGQGQQAHAEAKLAVRVSRDQAVRLERRGKAVSDRPVDAKLHREVRDGDAILPLGDDRERVQPPVERLKRVRLLRGRRARSYVVCLT